MSFDTREPGVVVGADGSPANAGALAWAAAEAAGVGADLLLIVALETNATITRIPDTFRRIEAAARSSLTQDQQTVATAYPDLTTRTQVVVGKASPELITHAREGKLIVVGRRGHGRFASLLLGSTSLSTAGSADGVVVVVPQDWQGPTHGQAPIAVGVDVDEPDLASLRFAFERCQRLEQSLRVIAVCDPAGLPYWDPSDIPNFREHLEQQTSEQLEKILANDRSQFPGVDVEPVVAQGHPAEAVLTAGADAELLVLGPRGRGTLGGFRIGSTTRAVLLHATTPVAVVHPVPDPDPAQHETTTAG